MEQQIIIDSLGADALLGVVIAFVVFLAFVVITERLK